MRFYDILRYLILFVTLTPVFAVQYSFNGQKRLMQAASPNIKDVLVLKAHLLDLKHEFNMQKMQHNIALTKHISVLNNTMTRLSYLVYLESQDYTSCHPLHHEASSKQCSELPKHMRQILNRADEMDDVTQVMVEEEIDLIIWSLQQVDEEAESLRTCSLQMNAEVDAVMEEAHKLPGFTESSRNYWDKLERADDLGKQEKSPDLEVDMVDLLRAFKVQIATRTGPHHPKTQYSPYPITTTAKTSAFIRHMPATCMHGPKAANLCKVTTYDCTISLKIRSSPPYPRTKGKTPGIEIISEEVICGDGQEKQVTLIPSDWLVEVVARNEKTFVVEFRWGNVVLMM